MIFDTDHDLEEWLTDPLKPLLKEYFEQCELLNCDPIKGMLLLNLTTMQHLLDEYNIGWQVYCGTLQHMCADPEIRNLIPKRKIN